MKLSIVATLYQSSSYIIEFYQRVTKVAQQYAKDDYEIVLVNDGSPDDSLQLAVGLTKDDNHVVVVDLSRNFGHHKAMMAGLAHAKGEQIFLLDSDLEEEPEWLIEFSNKLKELECDVIYGVQKERRGGMIERASGYIYYSLFRFFTKIPQPNNIVTARLMTKRYVDALLLHTESEINIGGLWMITGFEQHKYQLVKHSKSKTTYTLSNKLSHLVNGITSFSNLPLVFAFYTGLTISIFAGLYVLRLIINYFFFERPIDGYTSLIASIWLLAGVILFFIGVLGIYVAKIFSEVKNRPNAIVKNIYSKENVNKKYTHSNAN